MIKKIENKILEIALDIAKNGDGALFVIGDNVKYSKLFKQKFRLFSIFDKGAGKLLRKIAEIDGAVIISKKGIVKDYGVMIKSGKAFTGYGTRHAAALTASKNENIAVLCSEEEKKVKIFRDGKYIMQMDALQKNIEKNVPQAITLLESIGAGTIGTIGTATLAPQIAISLLPGILIFGVGYYAIKNLLNIKNLRKLLRR